MTDSLDPPSFDRARRRRFGQNFLVDPGTKRRLVELFEPQATDTVVEIGPGEGALTLALAASGARLHLIEIDRDLATRLESRFASDERVSVQCIDALEVDWERLATELGTPIRIFGNLPYNVGTAIVRRVLACDRFRDAQFMLQKEAADRLLSAPGSKAYGAISVVRALRCSGKRLAVLSPGVFQPRPKVDSAVIRLDRIEEPPLPAEEIGALEHWLHLGFRHRRKTLAGNLKPLGDVTRELLDERSLPADARAEALPPDVWLELARRLARAG